MSWNIVPEIISLFFCGIIWGYSRRGSHLPSLKNRTFQGCLMVTLGAMLSNILSTAMIYYLHQFPLEITWLVTTIYFVLTPLMGLFYFWYTAAIIYENHVRLKWVLQLGTIPAIPYFLIVLANPATGHLFLLDLVNGYTRGPLIFTTYLVFYIYCILCVIVAAINWKRLGRTAYRCLVSFPLLAVVVVLVQQKFPDIILSGSAATCAMLLIYLNLQNKQISLDYLTGLPNRKELMEMMDLMLKRASEKPFVLLVVSLREFRQINNAGGQQTGNRFLEKFCGFLEEIGPKKQIYRFGGDEFALLFDGKEEEVRTCIRKIESRMLEPWQIEEYQFVISAVMGVMRHSNKDDTLEHVINSVEYAVFQAKAGRQGNVCYCNQEMLQQLERKDQIIQILKEKLADESFEMYYQPIYCVKTGKFSFAESLMRIPDSPIGPIYPSEFIPIAEDTGLIIDITYIVLKKVCNTIKRLHKMGSGPDSIHVNFSAIQFSQSNLAERVTEILLQNQTPFSAIKIEFTESTVAENAEAVTEFAMDMKGKGIEMGLDDFGTGYSNVATVIQIPFGVVKLDRSLVHASIDNPVSANAVQDLVRMFHTLGMRVVAEGVENQEQDQLVKNFGVDQIQGFLYARPMPEQEFIEMYLAFQEASSSDESGKGLYHGK